MNILLENVPKEFFDYCELIKQEPIVVLKGFIGDLCELRWFVNQGPLTFDLSYNSHGSDERMLANKYVDRAFPNYDTDN